MEKFAVTDFCSIFITERLSWQKYHWPHRFSIVSAIANDHYVRGFFLCVKISFHEENPLAQ